MLIGKSGRQPHCKRFLCSEQCAGYNIRGVDIMLEMKPMPGCSDSCSNYLIWQLIKSTGLLGPCSFCKSKVFILSKVGGGAESVTLATETKINRFLGNATNFCVSVTDTPGLGDTECRDEEHMKGIIEAILDKQRVDLFVWIFRGTDNRFDSRIDI